MNFSTKVVEPEFQKNIDNDFYLMNGYENKMGFSNEKICTKGISTGISRYSLRMDVEDGELLEEPKMKTIGMPNINMTIPLKVRKSLDKVIDIILDLSNEELLDYIEEYKKEFFKYKPSDIAEMSGVTHLHKYAQGVNTKGIYHRSKASLYYNDLLKKHQLEDIYDIIEENDKVMFILLKDNNITDANVLGFKEDAFLKDVGLLDYINYDLHFQKLFLEPLKKFCGTINWKTDRGSSLMSLF